MNMSAGTYMSESSFASLHPEWSPLRRWCYAIATSHTFEHITGFVILINSVFVIHETDCKVDGLAECMPGMPWILRSFLLLYTVELAIRLCALRLKYLQSQSGVLDMSIVVLDIVCETLGYAIGDSTPSVSVLRLFRVLRIVRVLRAVKSLRELAFLLQGIGCVMKAVVWASFVLFFFLTFWSIVAVEILHPLNVEIAEAGAYASCDRCGRAFRSVMESNLTFVQSILAGDSWGLIAVPVIEAHPWTAFIFLGALLSIQLGVMNLILSVIVDRSVEARLDDEKAIAKKKEQSFQHNARKMKRLFRQIDADGNGDLTFEELMAASRENEEFNATLKALDATDEDLPMIFSMLDCDGSGAVGCDEFIEQLHKMKTQDSQFILISLKYHVSCLRKDMRAQVQLLENHVLQTQHAIADRLAHLMHTMDTVATTETSIGSSGSSFLSRKANEDVASVIKKKIADAEVDPLPLKAVHPDANENRVDEALPFPPTLPKSGRALGAWLEKVRRHAGELVDEHPSATRQQPLVVGAENKEVGGVCLAPALATLEMQKNARVIKESVQPGRILNPAHVDRGMAVRCPRNGVAIQHHIKPAARESASAGAADEYVISRFVDELSGSGAAEGRASSQEVPMDMPENRCFL
eukprot:TRINITY_DN20271_c0_g6_i1.p1 TRINITY_DN20271_c0_g6~~TRINITY_DN20271_c0_g6_i1.p1  ORF type:complete len:638 (-),score=121.44 TRINITY_DN20271_c0_g6_i1:146-2059(-)